jgi:GH25 family lysozyme M1 (1,4-beta-N-acetylmuramidase)
MTTTIRCVDLSSWQAGFDFNTFKNNGGLAVILKASEALVKDGHYDRFRAEAKAAGLAIASYHFYRPGDPTRQAEFYLSSAKPAHGERVVVDFEDASCNGSSVVAFLKHIAAVDSTLQLTVYGSTSFLETKFRESPDTPWLATNTSLWAAEYSNRPAPSTSIFWNAWSLWQYSDNAHVPGYAGEVDANRFDGPDDLLLKWFGPASQFPAPAPAPVVVALTDAQKTTITQALDATGYTVSFNPDFTATIQPK